MACDDVTCASILKTFRLAHMLGMASAFATVVCLLGDVRVSAAIDHSVKRIAWQRWRVAVAGESDGQAGMMSKCMCVAMRTQFTVGMHTLEEVLYHLYDAIYSRIHIMWDHDHCERDISTVIKEDTESVMKTPLLLPPPYCLPLRVFRA